MCLVVLVIAFIFAASLNVAVRVPTASTRTASVLGTFLIIFLIASIALLISALVYEVRCITRTGYLKEIVAVKNSEFADLIPFANNCQVYAIASIVIPFIFSLILFNSVKRKIMQYSNQKSF